MTGAQRLGILSPERSPADSWSIYIEPKSTTKSRLILRSCIEFLDELGWLAPLAVWLGEAIDFVMEQRMPCTLKRLAESDGSH